MIATLGTANLGGIDPLSEIGVICAKAGMWLHIGGADAGGYIYSKEFRSTKLKGIENCDSFCFGGATLGIASSACILVSRTDKNSLFKDVRVLVEFD